MKDDTIKVFQQKSNLVIDYINSNLNVPIQLDEIAREINVSKRQLSRIMNSYLTESLGAYIIRLRMERALMYLQVREVSLTELANMVGYESSQSFSKAFQKQFNISPSVYMRSLRNRLSELVKDTTINSISPEVISVEQDLDLVYIRIIGKYGDDLIYENAWDKLIRFLEKKKLLDESNRYIGISLDDPNITDFQQCRFYACASIRQHNLKLDNEFGMISIPSGRYAVYTSKGSYSNLQSFYNNIYLNPPYQIRYGVAFEEYMNSPQNTREEDLITKIFIPIK